MAAELDLKTYKFLFANYKNVLSAFAKQKKKPDLVSLDNWFQNSLGNELRKSNEMNKEQLERLMTWKLKRGKFRPQLVGMVKENTAESISKHSKDAFCEQRDEQKALQHLCSLRAVGPATASAIMTAFCPERFAFMADEAVLEVLPGKITYNMKYYIKYLEQVKQQAKKLSSEDEERSWSPHDVEIALWTNHLRKKLNTEFIEQNNNDASENNAKESEEKVLKKESEEKALDNETEEINLINECEEKFYENVPPLKKRKRGRPKKEDKKKQKTE